MNPVVQAASAAAWRDEAHVRDNRADLPPQVRAGHADARRPALDVRLPDAGFYLWAGIPSHLHGGGDIAFALGLLAQYNVTVLPGSLLARPSRGVNPGAGRIRLALVADADECVAAAQRILAYIDDIQ